MERRVRGNSHARCGVGENPKIASKDYLSLFFQRYPLAWKKWISHLRKETRNGKILKNEKYTGSVKLQKTYVQNFLEHKQACNEGQLDLYQIDNNINIKYYMGIPFTGE